MYRLNLQWPWLRKVVSISSTARALIHIDNCLLYFIIVYYCLLWFMIVFHALLLVVLFASIFVKTFFVSNLILFLFLSLLLYFYNNKHNFADLFVITVSASQIPLHYCGVFMFFNGLISILYSLVSKQDKTPMIPCILISLVISFCIDKYCLFF